MRCASSKVTDAMSSSSLEPAGIGTVHRGEARKRSPRCAPRHRVGEHAPHGGVVVDRIVLVTRAEVDDPTRATPEGAAAAEHLPATEGADEHELVRHWDVEELPVHLVLLEH